MSCGIVRLPDVQCGHLEERWRVTEASAIRSPPQRSSPIFRIVTVQFITLHLFFCVSSRETDGGRTRVAEVPRAVGCNVIIRQDEANTLLLHFAVAAGRMTNGFCAHSHSHKHFRPATPGKSRSCSLTHFDKNTLLRLILRVRLVLDRLPVGPKTTEAIDNLFFRRPAARNPVQRNVAPCSASPTKLSTTKFANLHNATTRAYYNNCSWLAAGKPVAR